MKFKIKDIKATFLDWELTFKQIKPNSYHQFLGAENPIPRDYYLFEEDEKGEEVVKIDIQKLNHEQYDFMMNKDIKFLTLMLKKAEYKGEGEQEIPSNADEKDILLTLLIEESDEFAEWTKGYINGQKKT